MIEGKRRGLSAEQQAELWKRWKAGQSLHEIGRALGKDHIVVQFVLARQRRDCAARSLCVSTLGQDYNPTIVPTGPVKSTSYSSSPRRPKLRENDSSPSGAEPSAWSAAAGGVDCPSLNPCDQVFLIFMCFLLIADVFWLRTAARAGQVAPKSEETALRKVHSVR
jgi:hypothetical protein